MARPGHAYPQVEPRARDVLDVRVAECPVDASVNDALSLARQRGVPAIAVSVAGLILVAHLKQAVARGLGSTAARALETTMASVDGDASEIIVRRRRLAGAAVVVVTDGLRVLGAVGRAGLSRLARAGTRPWSDDDATIPGEG